MYCKKCDIKIQDRQKYCRYCEEEIAREKFSIKIRDDLFNHKNFLNKLKDGNYSLKKSFWLFYFIFMVLFTIIFISIVAILEISPRLSIIILLTYTLIISIYSYFLFSGIWESANRYKGSRIWSIVSKLIIVFTLIGLFIISLIPFIYAIRGFLKLFL
jgi:hypothetical protein